MAISPAQALQALAGLDPRALAQLLADAGAKKPARKPATGKIQGTFGTSRNYAVEYVHGAGDLTAANYALVLAAARADGHTWLDGSNKPIVHMLKATGATWRGAPARKEIISRTRKAIFGAKATRSGK